MDDSRIRKLGKAIQHLDQDDSAQKKLINNGKKWVRERFSSELYGKRMHDLYADVAAGRPDRK